MVESRKRKQVVGKWPGGRGQDNHQPGHGEGGFWGERRGEIDRRNKYLSSIEK